MKKKKDNNHSNKKKRTGKEKLIIILISCGIIASLVFIPIGIDIIGENPKFIETDWIEIEKIGSISKMHSTFGHGYGTGGIDHPVNDKHYFTPTIEFANTNNSIRLYSPTKCIITRCFEELNTLSDGTHQGYEIEMKSLEHPSITFIIFHINLFENISRFSIVEEGQWLGYGDCRDNSSTDIAVKRGFEYISFFELMTDSLFEKYQARGIKSRNTMIKTDEEIEESANLGYACPWENFAVSDPGDTVILKNTEYPSLITTEIVDSSIFDNISYSTNLLKDSNDETNYENASHTTWMNVNQTYAGSYSNSIYAPLDGVINEIWEVGTDELNHYISIMYISERYSLELKFFGIQKVSGLDIGDTVSAGEKIGDISTALGINICWKARNTPISLFVLMSDSIWDTWSLRGLDNRSSTLLTYNEFESIAKANTQTNFQFDTSNYWWIDLI